MESARAYRWQGWTLPNGSWFWKMEHRIAIRRERAATRMILAHLRALRSEESARFGVGK